MQIPYSADRPAPPKYLLRVLAQTACAVLKGESNISYSQTKDGSRIRVKVPRQTRRAIEVARFILRANMIYISRKHDLYFAQNCKLHARERREIQVITIKRK
jgi:hypothetical protein